MKNNIDFREISHNKLNEIECEKMYLEWVNNFLTIERFCEFYNFTKNEAIRILNFGYSYHLKKHNKQIQKIYNSI